jgi:hypothetical protein
MKFSMMILSEAIKYLNFLIPCHFKSNMSAVRNFDVKAALLKLRRVLRLCVITDRGAVSNFFRATVCGM